MLLRFAANLNFLFAEESANLAEKIRLAHRAGFRAVEIPFPNADADDVLKAKNETGVEVALINIALGSDDLKFGAASVPGAEEVFKQHLHETIDFAKKLECKKIHIMAGLIKGDLMEACLKTYRKNIKYAANCLEKENIIGVIEPINKFSLPSYFMNSYDTASSILREINSDHMRLMMDVFHLQQIRGDITHAFEEMRDIIGHIQIAQVPHRHEPDVVGELDFSHIFYTIEKMGYNGWIGCEYKPKSNTLDGLKWFSKFGLKL